MHLQAIHPLTIRWEFHYLAVATSLFAFAPTTWRLPTLAAALALPAGHAAAALLRHLSRPINAPPVFFALPMAALWAVITARWTSGDIPDWWLPTALTFTWFAVTLTVADLRSRRLPNALTLAAYPALAISLTAAARASPDLTWHAILGASALLALHGTIHLWLPTALGAGDVKVSAPIGATLGAVTPAAIAPALLLASAITLTLYYLSAHRRHAIPYGPGLLGATALFTTFPDLIGGFP
ncbi:prepilin peptidase [Actinokineospora sp. HUAS TT18]|uniref:prepilin peptidase n=1 Tax=Actinokineospora sp. HUAS TT18 TaxID=3447451 RepID=UPI003F51CA72